MNLFKKKENLERPVVPDMVSMLGNDNYKLFKSVKSGLDILDIKTLYASYSINAPLVFHGENRGAATDSDRSDRTNHFCKFIKTLDATQYASYNAIKTSYDNNNTIIDRCNAKIEMYIGELETYINNSTKLLSSDITKDLNTLKSQKIDTSYLKYTCVQKGGRRKTKRRQRKNKTRRHKKRN